MPRPPGAVVALAGMMAAYVAVFGWLTWQQQSNYGTFGYDMGLHDQGIWLLSRFETPFVTIRGLHYFGHHVNVVSLLYVPLYRLGAGPHVLYLTETMALAAAAVPIWLLARHRFEGHEAAGWIALVPAGAFLLHPSVEWMNWWHWHPDVLAVTPLLFAWWFAVRRRWGWFAVMVALTLSAKEDAALAVLMVGVVLALFRRERRAGAATAVAGLGWFLVATRLVIPAYLDGGPFYARQLFPDFGDSQGEVVVNILTNPDDVLRLATGEERLEYYTKMLAPVALLALLGAPFLLIAGPQAGANVLSSLPGTYDIRFHYSAMVVAGVFIATVEGLGWLRRRWPPLAGAAVSVLAVTALAANVAWSPSPLGRDYDSGIWARPQPKHAAFDQAIALIPEDAGVSASYDLVPHLTHRRHAYEWPNPWIVTNWGLDGENPPDPGTVDYIVLDTDLAQEPDLLARLTGPTGAFRVIYDEPGVVLAERR